MDFIRGQKSKLSDLTPATNVDIGVFITVAPGQVIDFSCFGLDANGKLSDDRYFIFFNQKSSPCGSITMKGGQTGLQEVFGIDLGRVPETIKRLVFTASVDGAGTMSQIGASRLQMLVNGQSLHTFAFSGTDFGQEKAIMLAELYHKEVWRFAANGQGFTGGLNALLVSFGGEAIQPAAPPPVPPPSAPPPVASTSAPPPVPPPPKVNLGKVTLEKRGAAQAVNLRKGGGNQPIHINLNWDQPAAKRGFLGALSSSGSVDLDLGCMFRLSDGQKGVIQPLGGNFGSRSQPPYIHLDKDDRSGAATDGENMFIFRPDLIDQVMVFAMIYEGTANFSTVNGRLKIKDDAGSEILIPLNAPDSRKQFCAVAMIKKEGNSIKIVKEERYFPGHQECDEAYGFGFRWVAGQK